MTKFSKLYDYLLLSAAVAGDALGEFRNFGGLIPNLVAAGYGIIPPNFKKKSYRSTVSRMIKTGDLKKKIGMDGRPYLEITPAGREKTRKRFSIPIDSEWNKEFMVVIFDIPENKKQIRENLRKKIKSLGFGLLQKSVWISPYHFESELSEYLEDKGYNDFVWVLKAKKILGKDLSLVSGKVWDLDKLNSNYIKINSLLLKQQNGILNEKDLKTAWNLYLNTLSEDPMLPRELLPANWSRERACQVLKQITGSEKSSVKNAK